MSHGGLAALISKGLSDADFAKELLKLRCRLYAVQQPQEISLKQRLVSSRQPKVGVCPVQWGANDIAFRCLDCEHDSSCVQCTDCFLKANHEGHDVRFIRTSGGTCDCGDPSSWDPAGFCPDHREVQPHLDGPGSLELLPEDMRKQAREAIPELFLAVDNLLEGSHTEDRIKRCSQVLAVITELSEVAFGFRHLACQQLEAERIIRWLKAHLEMNVFNDDTLDHLVSPPAEVCDLQDYLLLLAQVSPSFKRRFAIVFSELYDPITRQRTVSHRSALHGLTVQLYTIPEIGLSLTKDHGMIEKCASLIKEALSAPEPTDTRGIVSFEERQEGLLLQRSVSDLKFFFHESPVCEHFLSARAMQDVLLDALSPLWQFNKQERRTVDHIEYEEVGYTRAFTSEGYLWHGLDALCEQCRRPEATWDSLCSWYQALVAAIEALPGWRGGYNTPDVATFHLFHLRLLARSINFDLLVASDAANWTAIFTVPFLVEAIFHVVRVLRFASEIRAGRWVRNGDAMRVQELHYTDAARRDDIMMLQACFILLSMHSPSATVDPIGLMWMACMEPDIRLAGEEDMEQDDPVLAMRMGLKDASEVLPKSALLEQLEKVISRGGARDGGSPVAPEVDVVKSRHDLFWETLAHTLNETLVIAVSTCRRQWKDHYERHCPVLLQRCLVQVLAEKNLSAPEVMKLLPKDLSAREPQVMEALEAVATKQDKSFTLKPRAWSYFDFFQSPIGRFRLERDRNKAEEAAIASKEAKLLGPRRSDGLTVVARLQDVLVESLSRTALVDMLLMLLHQMLANQALGTASSQPVAIPLESALVPALKVVDIIYDVSAVEGGGLSSLAMRFCEEPQRDLKVGSCMELQDMTAAQENGKLVTVCSFATDGTVSVQLLGNESSSNEPSGSAAGASSSDMLLSVRPSNLKVPNFAANLHSVLLERLSTLQRNLTGHAVLSRIVGSLPHRLRDRWSAVGLSERGVVAASGGNAAKSQKQLRMEGMKQKQQAMLQRMQKQQRSAAAQLGVDLNVEDTSASVNNGPVKEGEEDVSGWTCATCREAHDPNKILCIVADVELCNAPKFQAGVEKPVLRFTSCGHMLHSGCCNQIMMEQRRQPPRERPGLNTAQGEFTCPMCRSLANCALPCLPAESLLEVVDDAMSTPAAHAWLPIESSDRETFVRVKDQKNSANTWKEFLQFPLLKTRFDISAGAGSGRGISDVMLEAAAGQLAVTASLSSHQLADAGPLPPTYAVILRCGLALQTLSKRKQKAGDCNVLARLNASPERSQPGGVALAAYATLVSVFSEELCGSQGLSQKRFSELVAVLLAELVKEDPEKSGPGSLVSFLCFAGWLSAAVWQWSALDRTRLAHLDPSDTDALNVGRSLLRLPDSVPTADWLFGPSGSTGPARPGSLAHVGWFGRAELVSFIQLPERFLDIIPMVYKKPCSVCKNVPGEPALCLLTGEVVCFDSSTCRSRVVPPETAAQQRTQDLSEGQCTGHARKHGAGQGLFLLPYHSMVLAVSAPVCCLWEAPYVDSAGEPNPYNSRPCLMKLRLDTRRLDTLRQRFTTGSIRREIARHNERTGTYIPRPL